MSESKEHPKRCDQIKYSKDSDNLDLGIEKQCSIEKVVEVHNNNENERITKCEISQLSIAPHYIRDYEIKKPTEKEPSFLKMISNKIKRKQECK